MFIITFYCFIKKNMKCLHTVVLINAKYGVLELSVPIQFSLSSILFGFISCNVTVFYLRLFQTDNHVT